MHHNCRESAYEFDHVITIRDAVHGIGAGSVKSEKLCRIGTVQRIGRSGQSTASERAFVHAAADGHDPLRIASEHLEIGSHVVGQSDRLRFLKMGESGHICMDVGLHNFIDRPQKFDQKIFRLVYLVPYEQSHIESHLIVAAPAGMKFLSGIADSLGKHSLDK